MTPGVLAELRLMQAKGSERPAEAGLSNLSCD